MLDTLPAQLIPVCVHIWYMYVPIPVVPVTLVCETGMARVSGGIFPLEKHQIITRQVGGVLIDGSGLQLCMLYIRHSPGIKHQLMVIYMQSEPSRLQVQSDLCTKETI